MKKKIIKRTTCRLCDSKNILNVLPLTPTSFCEAYITYERLNDEQEVFPLDLYMCCDCFYVYQPYVLSLESKVNDYIYISTTSQGLSEHFQNYAEEVLARLQVPDRSLVVDIGSNDGTLLRFFKENTMRVVGIEPVPLFSSEAKEQGIPTFTEFFSVELALRIKREFGPASIITINNLLANIDDLKDLMKGVLALLTHNGVFIIETSYLGNIVESKIFDFIYHEHLSYFSIKPLKKFIYSLTLELIDIEEVSAKGGSLRFYVQRIGGKRQAQPIISELLKKEEKIGLDKLDTFKKLSEDIDSIKKKICSRLEDLKKKGKSIAGIGASATTTTMIYHFGIAHLIDYIVDDNPTKQNTYSPGYHIPVFASNHIYEKKPDYLVIFAWRFVDTILQNHKFFLDQGGHFIIPLPHYAEK